MMNMDMLQLKNFKAFDIALLTLFVIYIVFPIETPKWMVPLVDSPLGLMFMFAVTVALFVYKSPILGVLYILVAYEALRRNNYNAPASPVVQETKHMANRVGHVLPETQSSKDAEMQMMNPAGEISLEEEVIAKEVPVGKSELPTYRESSFKPVADKSELQMTQY